MKVKFVRPAQCTSLSANCPEVIIEFKPRRLRFVGMGYVDEGEAGAKDFKKYPVVERPWLNKEGLK